MDRIFFIASVRQSSEDHNEDNLTRTIAMQCTNKQCKKEFLTKYLNTQSIF